MVIFVDDLKRSRPPSAIDICDVANQLLDHPGVFIVYLADMAKIASTVEIKYKDYAGWSVQPDNDSAVSGSSAPDVHPTNGHRWWGRAYMEKMVQIQIDVDSFQVDAKRAGLDPEVVGRVISRNTEESETYRRAEAVAVDFLPNNPRAIKRVANRLRFSVAVAEELDRVFGPDSWVDPRLVGKWAVLTSRWPTLIESLRSGELNMGDLESQRGKDLTPKLRGHVRPEVESQEIDQITRLLGDDPTFGESIDQFLYHRLAPVRLTDEPHPLEPTHPS